jgi:hypothetical protein
MNTPEYTIYKVQELNIRGVVYYTDEHRNLFHIMDVIHRIPNPRIIGRWFTTHDGMVDVRLDPNIRNGK